jgi:hypothetical protein
MSTQIEEEGNEEGVEDVVDGLIDSLIDAIYFDDLVLEKDVADDVDQIEVLFVIIMQSMQIIRQSLKKLKKPVKCKCFNLFVFVPGKVFLNLDNRSRMMSSKSVRLFFLLLTLTTFLRIIR